MSSAIGSPTTPDAPAEPAPTRAVILARGLGTRMRRTDTTADLSDAQARVAALGLKAMMPIGGDDGRPFIEHVIHALAEAGITRVCLVIGPEHQLVRDWFAAVDTRRVRIEFTVQDEALGTADAVRAARDWVGDERFLMLNSDNHYPVDTLRALAAAPGNALLGFDADTLVEESNIPADRIAAFALTATDDDGHLVDIVEKPTPEQRAAIGQDARVSMNCFCFTPAIFDAADRVGLSPRGEYELVDAVRLLVADGVPVTVVPVAAGVLDMSGRGDVAAVSDRLGHEQVRL